MEINTHEKVNPKLCGIVKEIKPGYSKIMLKTTQEMAVDKKGLIHGGFIFGLADYAAMLAVNHPHVVLSGAEVKFLKPVKINDQIIAEAKKISEQGKKVICEVFVKSNDIIIFSGSFICYILKNHVLNA